MKAISVKQPWANMIASGEKTIETRTWQTPHRGQLLIVSSKRPNISPAGSAVAVCMLLKCEPMEKRHIKQACCDLYPKAQAWHLGYVEKMEPFPVKGKLGVYDCSFFWPLPARYSLEILRNRMSYVEIAKQLNDIPLGTSLVGEYSFKLGNARTITRSVVHNWFTGERKADFIARMGLHILLENT